MDDRRPAGEDGQPYVSVDRGLHGTPDDDDRGRVSPRVGSVGSLQPFSWRAAPGFIRGFDFCFRGPAEKEARRSDAAFGNTMGKSPASRESRGPAGRIRNSEAIAR